MDIDEDAIIRDRGPKGKGDAEAKKATHLPPTGTTTPLLTTNPCALTLEGMAADATTVASRIPAATQSVATTLEILAVVLVRIIVTAPKISLTGIRKSTT